MALINIGSIRYCKLLFLVWLDISNLYLFHLILRLNPVFSCCNNLLSSWVERVTTGIQFSICHLECYTCWSIYCWSCWIVTLCSNSRLRCHISQNTVTNTDHVTIRFTSQLSDGISRVLQKLFEYFNGTTISTSFVLLLSLSLFGVFPVIHVCF